MVVEEKETGQGFKQTEVGFIPKDWQLTILGSIAEVSSGGTPDRGNVAFWGGTIPWVTTSLIDYNTINEVDEFINEVGLLNSAAKKYKAGTLLMAMYGQGKTRGKVAILGIEATTNQACAAIQVSAKVSSKYVFFNLANRYEEIRNLSNTGNQENLNGNIIKSIPIPLPPSLDEQRAIATALRDVDALITSLDALITKKRNIKQGAMQQLLTGKKRLPGFSGGWVNKKFGDVISGFSSGSTPSRSNSSYYKGPVKWITSGELNYNVIVDTIEKISDEAVKNTNLKLHPKGTFLMAITGLEAEGTRGSCAITGVEATTNQSCMALFPTNELLTEYLFHYYVCYGNELAFQYCQGTKQQSYTAKLVKILPISLPPTVAEQRAIVQILSEMDTEIEVMEQKRNKYMAVKQGMMQQLLTGKIRLVQPQA